MSYEFANYYSGELYSGELLFYLIKNFKKMILSSWNI